MLKNFKTKTEIGSFTVEVPIVMCILFLLFTMSNQFRVNEVFLLIDNNIQNMKSLFSGTILLQIPIVTLIPILNLKINLKY